MAKSNCHYYHKWCGCLAIAPCSHMYNYLAPNLHEIAESPNIRIVTSSMCKFDYFVPNGQMGTNQYRAWKSEIRLVGDCEKFINGPS